MILPVIFTVGAVALIGVVIVAKLWPAVWGFVGSGLVKVNVFGFVAVIDLAGFFVLDTVVGVGTFLVVGFTTLVVRTFGCGTFVVGTTVVGAKT